MTRRPGELPEPEEALLGIERPTPEEEAETERIDKEKAQLRETFLVNLMDMPLFREWLMEQLIAFRTFEMPFGNSPTGFPDANATFYALGMKAAGWHLWEIFDRLSPELASKMRQERS